MGFNPAVDMAQPTKWDAPPSRRSVRQANVNYGSSQNPLAGLSNYIGGIQVPNLPNQEVSQSNNLGGGEDFLPNYEEFGPQGPSYQSPDMPYWEGSMRPTDVNVGDIRFGFEQQNPLKIASMNLFGQLAQLNMQAYLGQLGEQGQMQRAILSNMLGMKGLGVQRELGMGNIGANIFGTQAGLHGQLQGYEQSQREAELRQALGMSQIAQQREQAGQQYQLGLRGIAAPHEQRMSMLDRLLGPGQGIGQFLGMGGGSSGPVSSPTSGLRGGSQRGGPFEMALSQRMGAESAQNAADIGGQRMSLMNAATGPGGGMASAPGIDPLMAHSRAMADTQDMANLRQQLLGERQLGVSALGAIGGFM